MIRIEVMTAKGETAFLDHDLSLALLDLIHAVRFLEPTNRGRNKREEAVLDAARRLIEALGDASAD